MAEPERRPVYCLCCPPGRRQVLAMLEGDRLVINARRHGQRHTAVLDGLARCVRETEQGGEAP